MTGTFWHRFVLILLALSASLALADQKVFADATTEPAQETAPAGYKIPFKGTLYIVGGGAETALKPFVAMAGGANAHIVLIPHANDKPAEAADALANDLKALGVTHTTIILPNSGNRLPRDATAVYMQGGDQNRLMRLIDPQLVQDIKQFLYDGGLVAGSSAGAAAMVPTMIAGGMDNGGMVAGQLKLGQGLGFLPNVVVDTHVKEYVRHDRIKVAISVIDNVIGIGLDQDTALAISPSKVHTYGAGHVRITSKGPGFKSDATTLLDGADVTVFNVIESCVAPDKDVVLPTAQTTVHTST